MQIWCWPVLQLLQMIKPVLKWKVEIMNDGNTKRIFVSDRLYNQIYHMDVERTVLPRDEECKGRYPRSRLTFRIGTSVEGQKLPSSVLTKCQRYLDAMPNPKPFVEDMMVDDDNEEFMFRIGVNERQGDDKRVELNRSEQEMIAQAIFKFFCEVFEVDVHQIPLEISWAKWNNTPSRKRKASAMSEEQGMGGAALDTESDEVNAGESRFDTESDDEEQGQQAIDRLLDAAIDQLKNAVEAPVLKVEMVDLTDESAPAAGPAPVQPKQETVDLTDDSAPVKDDFVDLT